MVRTQSIVIMDSAIVWSFNNFGRNLGLIALVSYIEKSNLARCIVQLRSITLSMRFPARFMRLLGQGEVGLKRHRQI